VRFDIDVTDKNSGQRFQGSEVGIYKVKDDKVMQEVVSAPWSQATINETDSHQMVPIFLAAIFFAYHTLARRSLLTRRPAARVMSAYRSNRSPRSACRATARCSTNRRRSTPGRSSRWCGG
jgi:hypothetical protein